MQPLRKQKTENVIHFFAWKKITRAEPTALLPNGILLIRIIFACSHSLF